jgi:ABC-2 type transport system ATP-binding protein
MQSARLFWRAIQTPSPLALNSDANRTGSSGDRPHDRVMNNSVTSPAAVIEVKNLVRRYGDNTAVDNISFAIDGGSCTGLLGPNGAGKTTTIEIIEGVTPASSGTVLYHGEPLGARFREESGIQFQATALQDFLTVRETLALFHALYDQRTDLPALIETCSLGELLGRDNRLLLAIALINDPKIIFLDEPTTGLDPQARRNFWQLIERIKQQGTTVVLSTHYMDEAYQLCDRIIIMDRGRIIADGSPDQLLAEHFEEVVMRLPSEDLDRDFSVDAIASTRLAQRGDFTEIHTADAGACLQRLAAGESALTRLSIRPYNLEDLFIDLTGRELRS